MRGFRLIVAIVSLTALPLFGELSSSDCLDCHSDPTLTKELAGKAVSVSVDKDHFGASVHGAFDCADCHTDIKDYPHEPVPTKVDCAQCHPDAVAAYESGIHARAKKKNGSNGAATCLTCHGKGHDILPSSDPQSRTFRNNLPQTCGSCHGVKFVMEPSGFSVQPFFSYEQSVHGRAVTRGSKNAAVCTDCHSAHDIRSARDPESPIFKFNVPQTCGTCHEAESKEYLKSVHGKAMIRGNSQSPVCTDCHGIHMIRPHIDPTSSVTSQAIARTSCTRCHDGVKLTQEFGVAAKRVSTYGESYHGLANKLGSSVAANCASCHGVHNILPSSDPRSTVHKTRLVKTCGACHPGAGENFTKGKIHLDIPTAQDTGSIIVRWVRWFYIAIILGTIGSMLLHNFIIWWRKASAKRRDPNRVVVRMNRIQRIQHFLLLTSFFALVLTGFALAYPNSWIALLLGSNEAFRRIGHRIAAVVMMGVSLYHVGYMLFTVEGRKGLRDFWPRVHDLWDLIGTMRHYATGRGPRPQFRRFNYAEKAEYWALLWGTVVMTLTGLILWFKVIFSFLAPRWWVDVATAIHLYEAILATLSIIVWHLYQVIFDPDTYPMNWAWYDGKMTREQYEHEHPLDREALALEESPETETVTDDTQPEEE